MDYGIPFGFFAGIALSCGLEGLLFASKILLLFFYKIFAFLVLQTDDFLEALFIRCCLNKEGLCELLCSNRVRNKTQTSY